VTLVEAGRDGSNDVIGNVHRITVRTKLPDVVRKSRLNSKVRRVNLGALPPLPATTNRVNVIFRVYLVGLSEIKGLCAFRQTYHHTINNRLNGKKSHSASQPRIRKDRER
jgi:hypothetical protein